MASSDHRKWLLSFLGFIFISCPVCLPHSFLLLKVLSILAMGSQSNLLCKLHRIPDFPPWDTPKPPPGPPYPEKNGTKKAKAQSVVEVMPPWSEPYKSEGETTRAPTNAMAAAENGVQANVSNPKSFNLGLFSLSLENEENFYSDIRLRKVSR